jgi:hypothetical protein
MAAQFAGTFGPSAVVRQVRRGGKDSFSPDGKGAANWHPSRICRFF